MAGGARLVTNAHRYRCFGLTLYCAEALPGLRSVDADGTPDLVLDIGRTDVTARDWSAAAPCYRGDPTGDGAPIVEVRRTASDGTLFRYTEGAQFAVRADHAQVAMSWSAASTLEDAMTFFVGPVLSFIVRKRGRLALHASAVVLAEGAAAFVGPAGGGKSTTAAAFALAGAPVLTDDVLVLERAHERWYASAATPVVRLWPEAEQVLPALTRRLAPLTPTWEKLGFSLTANAFADAGAPLRVLFLLAPRTAAGPRVTRMRGRDALLELATHSSANYLLDAADRALELQQLADLLARVPLFRLEASPSPGTLPALRALVAATLREVATEPVTE
ncbi:MAG: hypothetical protein K2X99_03805 [Gemmatimonadaceae bacterium]|nr:hypothetical protein [Gemmatimonadaceae bacterium]